MSAARAAVRPTTNPLRTIARRAGIRRSGLAAARMCCERNVLATFGRKSAPRSRILCYHSVGTPRWGTNDVSPERFRSQLESALKAGYRFVPAERIAAGEGAPDELALTFDDGLRSVAKNAAPVLAEMGIPWTLFVVSDWADGKAWWAEDLLLDWREIERIAAAGATIGSHSVTHPRFSTLAPDEIRHELRESRSIIESRLGIVPAAFAVPSGQSRDWHAAAQTAALEAGYTSIYAQAEDTRTPGTVARTFITRFDGDRIFSAALAGKFDRWEEWV